MMMVAVSGCHHLFAQPEFGIEYAAEMQTDFVNQNLVNLLKLNFSQALCDGIRVDISSMSIAKTRSERLVDDLQIFSNIEEEDLPFAFAVAGVSFRCGHSQFFVGVRNLNEDYFTSPVTSLFTNSSCGIFPTISANFSIANYPLSSFGFHYAYEKESWKVQASVYNGRGYNGFSGGNSVFRFCPASDGVFGVTSVNYQRDRGSYYLGGALYNGLHVCKGQIEKRSLSGAVWGYVEQPLTQSLHLLIQYSVAFPSNVWCRMFGGVGLVMQLRMAEIGLFSDCASFSGKDEYASELTCKVTLSHHVALQPAVHLIQGVCEFRAVALMRLNITL